MSELVIGISTIGMAQKRRSVNSALDLINSSKKNLISTLHNLESDSRSSRLSTRIDELGQEYKQMLKIERNMQQIGKNIDYAISKFQEVDAKCAQALKASSYNYRSKVGLLTNEEKYGGIAGTVLDWGKAAWRKYNEINDDIISSEKKAWNKATTVICNFWTKNKDMIINGAIVFGEGVGSFFAITCLAFGTITGITEIILTVVAVVGIVYSLSTIWDSTRKIIRSGINGQSIDGCNYNPLEQLYEKFLGKDNGDTFYDYSSLGVAIFNMGAGGVGIVKAGGKIAKAEDGVNLVQSEIGKSQKQMYEAKKAYSIVKDKLASAKAIRNVAGDKYYDTINDSEASYRDIRKATASFGKAKKTVSAYKQEYSVASNVYKNVENQINKNESNLFQNLNSKTKTVFEEKFSSIASAYSFLSGWPLMKVENTIKSATDDMEIGNYVPPMIK
jgi:DNA-binding transcriptional regulator GbsR (MarR family)